MSTPNTRPLHMFKEDVAQRLQKGPFWWGGSAGYELERKYADLVHEDWLEGCTVDETAHAVHTLYMNRPTTVTHMTRASLESAGCRFPLEREESERQGDRLAMFRAEY